MVVMILKLRQSCKINILPDITLTMLPVLAAVATFISTGLGGLFALRQHHHVRLILGFTAGVLLGVVAFDVLPEIFDITRSNNFDTTGPMVALVGGFLLFHVIEKLVAPHHAHEGANVHGRQRVGVLSALALSGHSFFDGVGIGLAFQVNAKVGVAVTLAVIAHDFSDGLNTVSLMLAGGNTMKRAAKMLLLDATTPILGALSTLLFHLPEKWLAVYLGFFAGFLLYIGASNILPEAHREQTSRAALALTIVGAVFIFLVTRVSL